jgi:PKD repeat protein
MTLHTARNRFRIAAVITALALPLGGCTPSLTGDDGPSPDPASPAAWSAACDVTSCVYPGSEQRCLVDRNATGGALVPVAATLVFRAQIAGTLPTAPYHFAWNFGDGQTALPPATNAPDNLVQHAYASAGGHAVTVTVTDGTNARQVGTCQVTTAADPPLSVQCSASPDRGPAPLAVAFDVTTNCVGTCPVSWNFGDGSPQNLGARIEHRYTVAGTFTATGTLSDNRGRTDTCTRTISVSGGGVTPGSTRR